MTEVDATLSALADPMRRRVVGALSKGPRRPSDLADEFRLTRPVMSRHLRVLRQAGIVREQSVAADSRQRLYELCPEPFAELRGWLQEVEAFWSDQLGAFKSHAEKRARKRSS